MGQYIFLTGLYLPKPGATGMCIHQLAKECAKRGKDVTTICYADGDDRKTFDGVKIQKIHVPFFYQEIMSSNKIKRCINRLFSLGSKMLHIWNYPLRSKMLVNRYCKAIEMTIIQNNKATIVASVNPIEAVIAAGKMKQKYSDKIRIVYYCADTLSNEKGKSGLLSEKYRTKCGNKWEKKLFSMFDKVLIMECHRKHYYTEEYQQFIPKMHIVNFPLLTKPEINIKTVKDGKIRFVYAGTLYKELRNPSYLCEILVQLSSVMPIEVIFIGSGDCDDILDEACQRAKGAIKRLGLKPHHIVMNYLGSADILLSIGNTESPMAPSKIYEYMSTGKPIIHVYSYENDPCLEPLRKYGNALLLKEKSNNSFTRISNMINNSTILNYDEVKRNFLTATPGYTINLIEED